MGLRDCERKIKDSWMTCDALVAVLLIHVIDGSSILTCCTPCTVEVSGVLQQKQVSVCQRAQEFIAGLLKERFKFSSAVAANN